MIKVFVTTGTTEFDDLIKNIDIKLYELVDYSFIAQISRSANYLPKNIEYFDFSDRIDSYIDNADIIITHAGAGSVYSMLEKRKKIIVIPNLSRVDRHQKELANYVSRHNYALSCFNLEDLPILLECSKNQKFCRYQKDEFFGASQIMELLK